MRTRKVGIHSIPRPVTCGFYNEWLNKGHRTQAIGFPLMASVDDDSDAWNDWIRRNPPKPSAKSNP